MFWSYTDVLSRYCNVNWSNNRTNFNYSTLISWDNNPQKVIALDLDTDEHYLLTPKPLLRAITRLFEPKQIQSAITPNTFTAQENEIFSNLQSSNFRNRILFTKHSEKTVKLLGNAILYEFSATSEEHPTNFYSPRNRVRVNPYNALRDSLQDHFLNIAPLFAHDWFADAFVALFGYPWFYSHSMWNKFFIFVCKTCFYISSEIL